MTTAINFKSGEFYGDVHHGARASLFDIRRLTATRSEDEVETHCHDDAHFVLVLSGGYISSALHAPPRAPSPTLVFNPAGTTHRDRFVDGKGSFMTVSLDPALLSGAEELHAAQECAAVLRDTASAAAAFRIAREIGRGGDVALLEAGAWDMLAGLHRAAPTSRPALPAWAHQAYEAVMDLATDAHVRIADVAAAIGVHPVHLARVFRQAWGCSPGDLLRWRRVEQASGLLRRPELGMAEVALSVGFADQSHMTRAFQARYGMTPTKFRREMFQTSKTMTSSPN
jgi:AraC family transcriptional regulator